MNRLLLLIALSYACVVFVPAVVATTNEIIVERPTLARRVAHQLGSFFGFMETNEEPTATGTTGAASGETGIADDAALTADKKPVYQGTKKVGADFGENDAFDATGAFVPKKKTGPRVVAVKFSGHKHKPIKKAPEILDFKQPMVYNERIDYRKARRVLTDVMSEFPDKYKEVELSNHARCVNSDPYLPGWKNPIGLSNPTPLRKYARLVAQQAYEKDSSQGLREAKETIEATIINTNEKDPKDHSKSNILKEAEENHSNSTEDNQLKTTIKTLDEGIHNMSDMIRQNETQTVIQNLERLKAENIAREAADDAEDAKDAQDE
jgi:hypothetical protein